MIRKTGSDSFLPEIIFDSSEKFIPALQQSVNCPEDHKKTTEFRRRKEESKTFIVAGFLCWVSNKKQKFSHTEIFI